MKNRVSLSLLTGALLISSAELLAQAAPEPFKLGTFEVRGRAFVGAVLRDAQVIDLAAANEELQRSPLWVKLPMARSMKELIGRYEVDGLRQRISQIVSEVAARSRAGDRPFYLHDLKAAKILPPIPDPETILNAAVNYQEHAEEMGQRPPVDAKSAPGIWERKTGDNRHNPYLFLKPRSALIADGEAIRMPPERDRLDWECELNAVIGRPASRVKMEEAKEYIFGYTIQNDVSDRGGRGDQRHGSDWLIGKGHDTYAPLGPFIVPREFIQDPMNLGIKFTLSGKVMQDSNTSKMIHNVYELLQYASSILTLQPGDLISTGSPAGVGAGRNPPVFMKKGDKAVCWIEGIGTLTNPVQ